MESAKEVIARRLPPLIKKDGITYPSVYTESVSARFFHLWPAFAADVLRTCSELDLSSEVTMVDDNASDESFNVGSKLGLTGRFSKHVCDPVSKVLATTPLSDITFGDYNACSNARVDKTADVIILTSSTSKVMVVGELKTFWTLHLEEHTVDHPNSLIEIQAHLGQLVSYMRMHKLRFGFLSTYSATVFVRRAQDFRFELSLPMREFSVNPSVRQCFLALASWASAEPQYREDPAFMSEQLHIPAEPFSQASMRTSPLRPQAAPALGARSICCDDSENVTRVIVNCGRRLSQSAGKAMFLSEWEGQPCIVKCWSEERRASYQHEVNTYNWIHTKNPGGYEFFAPMLWYGTIACSSIFPAGNILVLGWVPGEPLITQWESIWDSDKAVIHRQLSKAVKVLRSFDTYCLDSGRHNVLFDQPTGRATLVDFEMMGMVEEWMRDAKPEIYSVFGPRGVPGTADE